MENLKIKVSSEAESKEAQELFFELGYKWIGIGAFYYKISPSFNYITAYCEGKTLAQGNGLDAKKEITLPDLRDLAVLKRDDRKDANVLEDNCLYDLYLTKSRELYFYHCGKNKWILSNLNGDDFYYELLKPIERKEMKEYLRKNSNGTYSYIGPVHTDHVHDLMIEIPVGAVKAYLNNSKTINFVNADDDYMNSLTDGKWVDTHRGKHDLCGHELIWQRNQEPKQAEFLVKTDSGYVLQVLDENAGGADVVRIPDGAEIAILASGVVYFWKSHFFNSGVHKDWVDMKEGWGASWYLKNVPSAITIWQRETLNDQVASAEEYREMISNAASISLTSVVTDIAQSCGGVGVDVSLQGQSDLNNSELNHRVAKAFNAVRGTDLNEDDVNYIRELINLTVSHYGERK